MLLVLWDCAEGSRALALLSEMRPSSFTEDLINRLGFYCLRDKGHVYCLARRVSGAVLKRHRREPNWDGGKDGPSLLWVKPSAALVPA